MITKNSWLDLPPGTYWITRDIGIEGVLEPACDVWGSKPNRVRYLTGYCWLTDGAGIYTLIARTSVEDTKRRWGVAPETDIECIRVEI